jgi:hypothetical protein
MPTSGRYPLTDHLLDLRVRILSQKDRWLAGDPVLGAPTPEVVSARSAAISLPPFAGLNT